MSSLRLGAQTECWIVAVPQEEEGEHEGPATHDAAALLHRVARPRSEVCEFSVPQMRFLSLGSLVETCDKLVQHERAAAAALKKVQRLHGMLCQRSVVATTLSVEGVAPHVYMRMFQWDQARYSLVRPVDELASTLNATITKLEADLKPIADAFLDNARVMRKLRRGRSASGRISFSESSVSNMLGSKSVKKTTGGLDLDDLIVHTDSLTTVSVTLPTRHAALFLSTYERYACGMVRLGDEDDEEEGERGAPALPRSARLVADNHNGLSMFTVVVLSAFVSHFVAACEEHGFLAHDMTAVPPEARKQGGAASPMHHARYMRQLKGTEKKCRQSLSAWCRTNYGMIFSTWLHIQAVRAFAELTLRFGPGTNVVAALLRPRRGEEKQLRRELCEAYAHLSRMPLVVEEALGKPDEADTAAGSESSLLPTEPYYPFVLVDCSRRGPF